MNKTIYASDFLKLNSNVYTGGGSDETEALQALLDKAADWGRLKLVMDGAALVSGLKVHSNTTIECLDKSCGFYLRDNSNCAILTNHNPCYTEIKTRNVTLIGGTYNHNCLHQEHHTECYDSSLASFVNNDADESVIEENSAEPLMKFTIALEFYGIENLNVRDVTVRDQRTFAFTIGNFKHVNIENTYIDLANEIPFGNQDGFHFWGPGQFLTIRNVGGKTQDDFMNIGPDERDGVSAITDVVVDGVFLDHAWQGIRLLSREKGLLDRVTIKNVTGTYNCYGFYINPWFMGKGLGNFGNLTFENIDLRPEKDLHLPEDYLSTHPPFLFNVGGDFESITFKNIHWYHAEDNRNVFQIGCPYHTPFIPFQNRKPRIKNLHIDGLKIIENEGCNNTDYILARGIIDRIVLRDVDLVRPDCDKETGTLIKVLSDGEIGKITLDRANLENLETVIDVNLGQTQKIALNSILEDNVKYVVKGENYTEIIKK